MQKFLRTLMLAALLLPFASNAQNSWTVANGTDLHATVPLDFYNCDGSGVRNAQMLYPASLLTDMTGQSLSAITFYHQNASATKTVSASTWYILMGTTTETDLSTGFSTVTLDTVYAGDLIVTGGVFTFEFDVPYIYNGGNLIVEIYTTGATGNWFGSANQGCYGVDAIGSTYSSMSSPNYTAFLPKTTFHKVPTCFDVTSLAVASATTSTITLTWADTINSGATYSVYDMSDTTLLQSGITGTTYTATGLDANKAYTLGVVTDCGGGDITDPVIITARTACPATMALPYAEEFNGYSGFQSYPYNGPSIMPACWDYYSNGTNTADSTTSAYYGGVARYTSTSSYGCMEANNPYLYLPIQLTGSAVTSNTYLGYATERGDTRFAIFPALDQAINTVQISFDYKMSTAYSATGAAATLELGYVTDDTSTFVSMQSYQAVTTTQNVVELNLSTLAATAPAGARLAFKFSGVHNGTSAYSYSNVACGIDNILVETLPNCSRITDLAINDSLTTSSSLTLTWVDALNTNATYTVYDMEDTSVVATGINALTYTVTDLDANTLYTFAVEANCSATDASSRALVSGRTSCAAEALPFTESFDATLANDFCWRGSSILYTDGVTPTLGSITGWNYASSVSNGLAAGHYKVNIYGTSCKYWLVTPTIDFSEATSPMLTFDAAFTKYSGTAVADGDITDDKFLILVSTNNGQTWTTASNINLSSLASLTYLTQYVDLSAYVGDTVRVAFYAESTVSGGDNNLHIDNISIDELVGDLCLPVSGLDVDDVTAEGATLSWNGTAAGSYTVVNMADGSVVTSGADTTYTLTGLTASTQYTYGVVANCTSSNSDTMVVTFNTACTALTLPYTEGFELTSNAIGCWSVEGTGSWTVGTGDYSASTGAFEGTYNAKITHGTTGNVTKLVSPALDGVENGLLLDFAYVMRAWSSDIDELRVYSRASETAAWQMIAEYTDAAATWTVANVIIPGTVYQVAFEYTDNYGYGLGIDSVVFTPMSGSFCFPVADLAVDSVTATSVFLSWSDENNTGATYSIYGDEGNVIATNVAGTSYEVTGLTALTGYTFGVVANCSETDASNVTLIDAVTACAGATCDVYIYAVDGYGDGWNDATIEVKQAGVVVASYSMADQGEEDVTVYDTAVVEVCASAPVALYWISGEYDDEIAFTIADYNGDSLYAVDSASNLIDGATFFATATPCGEVSDEVTITFAVNDATMGTTTPAPGTYTYEEGETISLSATAYEGYRLSGWHIEIPMLSVDTTVAADFPAYTDTVSFVMNGSTFTAIFAVDVPEATIAASDILYWVGEGSNQAVLAINWPDTALAWGYRFNGTATVQDMIEDIAEADLRFSYTIENGYLSDFTFVCENGETLTGANAGYWESKNNGISDAGMAQTLINGDFEKWANSAAGVVVDSIYYEGWGWSYIYNYPMTIHPVSVPAAETVTITFTVNDATMGTITPSGVRIFEVGDELTVTATPAEGCSFVSWTVTTAQGETMTLQRDMTSFTDTVEATWNGSTLTANFVRNQGIDEVESADFQAYSLNGKVIVKGVENMDVNVYDVTGRSVNNVAKSAETVEFTVPAAGVYMVKVGNAVKRVVVIR